MIAATADDRHADFDPAADRLRSRSRWAFRLIGLLVIGFFGMAAVLSIGGAVVAAGTVTVESSVKTILHPTGGVLKAILVRDGDRVQAGQVLMRLDTAVTEVGADSASLALEQLLARRARLEAERDGSAAIRFPPELTRDPSARSREAMARENEFFRIRKRERDGTIALLRQRQQQYREQIESYVAQIAAIDRQLALIEPEREGLRRLRERELVTINRVNEIERTAVQLAGSKAALQSNIAEARARISETEEQIRNIDKQVRSEAADQLADVLVQLNDQAVRAASTADTQDRSVIRAPQSGTVDKIAFTTPGSAIPPQQPLLQIVPDRDQLIVEGSIRPQDVDQVRVGQNARITFSGLNRQATPDFPGKLVFVSPELTTDERTGQRFYRIKVQIDSSALKRSPGVELRAGMPAEVFVETGSRSILSYLFKPLFDQIRYAARSDG